MITREEFENSFHNIMDWQDLSKEEISNALGSEVAGEVKFNQRNPHHCYDLFTHSLYATAALPDTSPVLLKVAAFFHDIGKPYVAMKKQNRLVFYGHACKSAEIAASLLKKLHYTDNEISEICFYIKHHDDFISWVLAEENSIDKNKYFIKITSENLVKHIHKVTNSLKENDFRPTVNHWNNLLKLCLADVSAQSDLVIQDDKIIDTKERKLRKIDSLLQCINILKRRECFL